MALDIDLPEVATPGAESRATLLTLLFRETDRAQRMKSPLSLILIALEPTTSLRTSSPQRLPLEIFQRVARLLRSYDLLGRLENEELFVMLPGCGASGAAMFVERLKACVFAVPFALDGEPIRFSANFGITTTIGRSPVVVLREAVQALRKARAAGPGACFSPATFRNL